MSLTGQPEENAVERDQRVAADAQETPVADTAPLDPLRTVRSEFSGLALMTAFGFDGSVMTRWNAPEADLLQWLSMTEFQIDESILDGSSGTFIATADRDGSPALLMVRFPSLEPDDLLETWGLEFHLTSELDLLSRSVAAYELAKAIGAEDITSPICNRDIDVGTQITDATRETVARKLKIQFGMVDDALGVAATTQLLPPALDSFAEKWASLGATNKDRWNAATDQLRYSLYRCYFLDFILGCSERPIPSLGYDINVDRVLMMDLSLSFPHVGFTAEKYIQMRAKGWGRNQGGVHRFVENTPPSANDLAWIFDGIEDRFVDEMVLVAEQLAGRMNDEMAVRLAVTLIENDIPQELVAGVLLRLAYLTFAPGSVIKKPIEFIRNFCVPMRSGITLSDLKAVHAVDYVNQVMTTVVGVPYDLAEVVTQAAPEPSEFVV